ncbi:MAG: LpqB family beta-propeller domain-containing protein [Actinomycetota bacterium]|nr:LpqB family beta-propeller domain-containing protein [Actinomycetota bacterium]
MTVAAACVTGCVGMPSNGAVGQISVSPQSTAAGGNVIQPFPAGPAPRDSPFNIVTGFLAASANPLNAAIAREYLVSTAVKTWKPGWSVTVFSNFGPAQTPAPRPGVRQASILASGPEQSTFNGSGQFVSAGGTAEDNYDFHLAKVNGQWRISNPPSKRLLTASEFTAYYKPQDLYFLSPSVLAGTVEQPLVPDSVFVPQGTSSSDLLNKLVRALLPNADGNPQSALLKTAALTFPGGTKLVNVALAGTTAVVNLSGLAGASKAVLEQVSAQLAWTLTSPRSFPPAPIQSVELERDGHPWIPPSVICGVQQPRSQVQNQATYSCYNPYPASTASFSFTSHTQVWSRCGSEDNAQRGLVGPVISLLRSASSAQACGGSPQVAATSSAAASPVPLSAGFGAPSLAAVSPDGQYVAAYWPAAKKLLTWQSATGFRLSQVNQVKEATSGVTALSWDRSDDLWFAQNGNVYVAPANGQASEVTAPQGVTDLAVAPDGIRIAFIVPDGLSREVDLAAIIRNAQSSPDNKAPSEAASISQDNVHLGPDLVRPQDLTWSDADDLIVLARNNGLTLSDVPVDGQESLATFSAPPGANSITANGAMNALIVGLSDGHLAVSTGLEGPWQVLGVLGQNPAYPG